jgi:D-3-phosphoglycerate dehydrogenase
MRVAISDPDVDMARAREILLAAGAEAVFERSNWTGDDIVAIVVGAEGELRAQDLQRCPNLRIVAALSTGVDNLDMDALRHEGVAVWSPKDYCSDEVADSVLAHLLGLLRGTTFLDRSVRHGSWHFAAAGSLGRIDETRLGIIGLGTIGRKVATRARALNMAVSSFDPFIAPDDEAVEALGVKLVGLDELLQTSNAITIHVPLTEATRNLISKDRIAVMPRGSILVNLARGKIVDTGAVLEALTSGQLSGAALDVLENEPPTDTSPAPRHPRLVVTPHAGWYSDRSARFLFQRPLEVIRDVLIHGTSSDLLSG